MNWHWHLTEDGTLRIYNGDSLYWEIDCCYNYTKLEQQKLAEEYIKDYKEWIKDV